MKTPKTNILGLKFNFKQDKLDDKKKSFIHSKKQSLDIPRLKIKNNPL